jgi:threonine/homoserine/homoserine lactone efflux protein
MFTNLLNPKAYLFMLAVFPQFLRPEHGSVARQALVLGLIIAATQAGVYGALALGAGGARDWLAARPGAGIVVNRGAGMLLIGVAMLTLATGLRMQ